MDGMNATYSWLYFCFPSLVAERARTRGPVMVSSSAVTWDEYVHNGVEENNRPSSRRETLEEEAEDGGEAERFERRVEMRESMEENKVRLP